MRVFPFYGSFEHVNAMAARRIFGSRRAFARVPVHARRRAGRFIAATKCAGGFVVAFQRTRANSSHVAPAPA